MSIAVESISFSYQAPSSKRKKKRFLLEYPLEEPRQQSEKKSGTSWGVNPAEAWALKNVSFEVADGEFFGIAGHTGSGKSTLLQHLNGLLHPTCGRVLIDGKDLSDKHTRATWRYHVGFVMQYPENQLFAACVFDDVAFGPRNLGLSEGEVRIRVEEALSQVFLDPNSISHKSPFELSGGQQRRVALAGVLAMKPSALVLDEPASGLDPLARKELLALIQQFNKEGTTIIMVSHSMDSLAQLCQRILILNKGEQVLLGTPDEVFSKRDHLHKIGLAAPLAQQCALDLKRQGVLLDDELYNEERLARDLSTLYRKTSSRA